jgi:hypothetical protein
LSSTSRSFSNLILSSSSVVPAPIWAWGLDICYIGLYQDLLSGEQVWSMGLGRELEASTLA